MSSSPLSDVPMSESGKIHDELASNVGENPLDSSHAELQKATNEDEKSTRNAGSPTKKRLCSSQQSNTSSVNGKGSRDRKWTAEFLLQNPKSPLAKVDLLAVFKNERAWGILDSEQQRNLLAMVPKPPRSPTEGIEQDSQSSRNIILSNSAFQSDVRMFQEDLADGRLQPAWLEKAHIAMERRARGDFDAWKEEETEKFWGQKQKISYYVIAGESSKVSVETLVDAGRFQVGDVWLYERSIQIKGKGKIQIEKEAKLSSITQDKSLTFTFPPGRHKYSTAESEPDILLEGIKGPNALAMAIVVEDGRVQNWRPANAWKEFRCLRKNQDMGSPWEIREMHYARHGLS